jgi:hypothetical protein
MTKKSLVLAATGLAFLAGGCASHPYWIAGHTSDYGQIFTGQGSSDGVSSSFTVTMEPRGTSCRGNGSNFGGNWSNTIKCDGLGQASYPISVDTKWQDSNSVWYGQGTFPNGTAFYMVEANSKAQVDKRLARFRVEAKSKKGGPLAATAPSPAVAAVAPPLPAAKRDRADFPSSPLALTFPKAPTRPDDVAVIIGNADYSKQGKDIPNVVPAYADAESFKRYVTEALGVRQGNIIDLRDATQADMISVFGTRDRPKGRLFNWVQSGLSNVTVYYAGHGAPAGDDGSPYLVPVNANPATIELNGYALETLYANLAKIPARSITVVIEACFSGAAEGGAVISNASPVFMKMKPPVVPPKVTVITAGAPNQLASWEQDKSHGLFTKYFLKGMSGEADAAPYGNGDGRVDGNELERYFQRTLTYYARRYYGRDQTARIVSGGTP